MQASKLFFLKPVLSPLAVVLVLAAPCAFAKKDLFANDPGSKQTPQAEQLVPTTNSSSSAPKETLKKETLKEEASTDTAKIEEKSDSTVKAKPTADTDSEKKSYLETQFVRFKGHLVEAKEDLFGKKATKKTVPSVPQQTESAANESAHSSEETHPEVPIISTTEAAQRAQSLAEGQVINVRKYAEDDKPRYAVKLLQKNGRMKTINVDAVSGALIEETSE